MEEYSYSLRPLMEKDADRMVEMMQDAQTTQFLQIGGPDYTKDTALGFICMSSDESMNLHRAVVDEADVYQGSVSLKHIDLEKKEAEYAISMHPQAQGKGAAKAASAGILELAWSMGLERVYLNVLDRNQRANCFYQKFGFRYTHSTTLDFRGATETLHWYECRREERT